MCLFTGKKWEGGGAKPPPPLSPSNCAVPCLNKQGRRYPSKLTVAVEHLNMNVKVVKWLFLYQLFPLSLHVMRQRNKQESLFENSLL